MLKAFLGTEYIKLLVVHCNFSEFLHFVVFEVYMNSLNRPTLASHQFTFFQLCFVLVRQQLLPSRFFCFLHFCVFDIVLPILTNFLHSMRPGLVRLISCF